MLIDLLTSLAKGSFILKQDHEAISMRIKYKNILTFETLRKCKLCLNAKPVEIKSSVHQALHGF